MEWSQVFAFILGNAALIIPLFLWSRAESRADNRSLENRILQFELKTDAVISAIREESKDFHARLCVIEERNRERK